MDTIAATMTILAEKARTKLDDNQRALCGAWVGLLAEEIKNDPTLEARSLAAGVILGIQSVTRTMTKYLPYGVVASMIEGPSQAAAVMCWQLEEFNEFLPCTEEEALLLIEQIMQKKPTDG